MHARDGSGRNNAPERHWPRIAARRPTDPEKPAIRLPIPFPKTDTYRPKASPFPHLPS